MTPVLVLLALVVAAGAVVAVSAQEPRLAAVGAVVALAGAVFVADPLPGLLALAARLVGTALAGYVVWVSLRDAPVSTAGSHVGWPGGAAIAVVAFVAGWFAGTATGASLAGLSGEGPTTAVASALVAGSPVALAAMGSAFALFALAIGPVLVARDVLRLGLGLGLMLAAAGMLQVALVGRADDPVEFAFAVLIAAGGAGVAGVVARSLQVHGDLELRAQGVREPSVRTRGVDDAHPLGTRH